MAEVQILLAFGELGFSSVKPEQMDVVKGILRRDVFAILPTGYGKSACFQCLPILLDKMFPDDGPSIILVVTPLTAIIKDQVMTLCRRGIRAGYVTGDQESDEVKEAVTEGEYQVVYFTPEMLLGSRKWREILLGDIYRSRLRALIIDEAHTVKKWGETFRRLLLRIGEIRSLLPAHAKIMALTAMATATLRMEVSKIVGMRDELVVSISPCKPNIMYSVIKFSSLTETFQPIVKKLLQDGADCPRVVVYCKSLKDCADIYEFFKNSLGANFTIPANAPTSVLEFRVVDMFMSCTDQEVRDSIIKLFSKTSNLRVIVATVAFGMGIDCPDVRQVIHYGSPSDVESYVQETGHAGRDGLPSMAVLLTNVGRTRHMEKSMSEYVTNETVCRRDILFNNFDNYSRVYGGPLCLCCDVCAKSCTCSMCSVNHSSFF